MHRRDLLRLAALSPLLAAAGGAVAAEAPGPIDLMPKFWQAYDDTRDADDRARALAATEPRLRRVSGSRARRGELGVWQRRYWEHRISDERDFARHVDYIHYNPVKHGLVRSPVEWPWSTFRRFVKDGLLPTDWGEASQGLARLEVDGE